MEQQIIEEGDVKTAVEIFKVGNTILWNKLDEKIRLAYNKRVEKSQKPSMWEYNPKGGVPTELANLDPSTFLTSPLGQALCSVPKDTLARICSKLSVRDFVYLSLTCRFLHWRMFTFCTCYVPYTVKMNVYDYRILKTMRAPIPPKLTYTLNDDDIIGEGNKGDDETGLIRKYISQQKGQRGLFVHQPFFLRKPFFFQMLEVDLTLPFYYKQFYDMALPYILAVRGLARHFDLLFYNYWSNMPSFNFPDTNDFLTVTNVSYYQNIHRHDYNHGICGRRDALDIYLNCPYAHQMYGVYITCPDGDPLNVPVFQNKLGIYQKPCDSAVIATLKNFLAERQVGNGNIDFHLWKKVVATENRGQLRILIKKREGGMGAHVKIGKDEAFDEIYMKYYNRSVFTEDNPWWKMETAVEPDDAEESEEDEDSDGDDEWQEPIGACLCLNNTSCSIQ